MGCYKTDQPTPCHRLSFLTCHVSNKKGSETDYGFRAFFVPFRGKKCDFLQVFVLRVLIFKKLHLLLHSKMEVQGKKCIENH